MRGVPEESVRAWRLLRACLSREAPDAATAVAALPPLPATPAAYVALHARVPSFRPAVLHRMVFEEGSLRVFPLPASGVSLVPVELVPCLLALHAFSWGSRARRSRTWRRKLADFERLGPALLGDLSTRPRPISELALPDAGAVGPATPRRQVLALASFLAARGEVQLSFEPTSLFGELTCALPRAPDRIPAASSATYAFLEEVALYFFRVAGPATRDDFLRWASLSRSAARHTIEDLAGVLDEVDVEGGREAHFMIEEDAADLRSLRPLGLGRPALLPSDDPSCRVTRRGFSGLCEPRLRPRLLKGRAGAVVRPALVGGAIVGSWQHSRGSGLVEIRAERALRDEEAMALDGAAASLSAFLRGELAPLPRGASKQARRASPY